MSKKIVASLLSALMAVVGLASPALAVYLSEYPTFFPEIPYIVVGEDAKPEDVIAAADIAIGLAELSTEEKTVEVVAEAEVTGGAPLDTADVKIYLTDYINKAISMLTSKELPAILARGSVEEADGSKYEYTQYLKVGQKSVSYEQPDTAAGLKDPDYLIRLGTDPTVDTAAKYVFEAWATFTKPFNASNAVGKELVLFGKSFTISAETDADNDPVVLFKLAEKVTVGAGEETTVTVGEVTHTVKVVGIIDASTAVVEINGVMKEVTEGRTYDFAGTSVYIEDVFYYKVPVETGSVVLSIGAERIVFDDTAKAVKIGPSGAEETVKGVELDISYTGGEITDIKFAFDAWTATPKVDYVLAGKTWTDPLFGIVFAYNGPAAVDTESIVVEPGAASYYTISFTDEYGYSGTVEFAYTADVTAATITEKLADSEGYDIHVVENAAAKLNEYVFVSAGGFPHMLRVTYLDVVSGATSKATFRDVFSGVEYSVERTGPGTVTLVIDGQSYTVTLTDATPDTVAIADGVAGTVVYPVLESQYGAEVVLIKKVTLNRVILNASTTAVQYVLPTGSVYFREKSDGTVLQYSTDGTTYSDIAAATNYLLNVTLGRVTYTFQVDSGDATANSSIDSVNVKDVTTPGVLIIEEQTKAGNQDAIVIPIYGDEGDDRLEVGTLVYTHASGDIYKDVGTATTNVEHSVTEWGTFLVEDMTGAGVITISYPDAQAYHLLAIGEAPEWKAVAEEVTYEEFVPVTTSVALLDTEVTDAHKAKSMILVGGPAVNRLTAEVWEVDYPTYGAELAELGLLPEGKAVIEVLDSPWADGKYVLLVVGWEAEHTRAAALALLQKTQLPDASKAIVEGTIAAGFTVTAA